MRFFIYLLLVSISFSVSAQEKVWRYQTSRDLEADRIQFYSSAGNKFDHSISDKIKTPEGDNSLEVKIVDSSPNAPSHAKQIIYRYNDQLSEGQEIKLSFYYKGSVDGKINAVASLAAAPFEALGKNSGKPLNVSGKWEKAEWTFVAAKNFNPIMAMPRLMLGTYPTGGILHLGPVKMEKLQTFLPLSLNKEWKLLKNPGHQCPLTEIPADAQTVQLQNDKLDLSGGKPHKLKEAVMLYNEFDAKTDGLMQIGMAADWWFECFVNGKKVFDTMLDGNYSERIVPKDQIFNFPVKKGKNVMAVKVYSGMKGWKFTAAKVDFVANPRQTHIYRITESAQFRPMDMNKMLIKKGTALDFSELNGKRQNVDKLGRIIINGNGKFAYQHAPDKEIRFLGFNFVMNYWRLKVHTWTHQDIENFADGVAHQGYNMVRLHFVDRYLLGYKVHSKPHRDRDIAQAGFPQSTAEIELDKGNYDRFEYMLACFKERGIYVNLDLMSASTGYSMAYRAKPGEETKLNNLFEDRYRTHWTIAVEYMLNRVNPYTKLALKDDPVVACVNFLNEQDIQLGKEAIIKKFSIEFQKWLRKKYGSDQALSTAWKQKMEIAAVKLNEELLRQGNNASKDAGTFLIETMNEMTGWYLAQVRKIGYNGLYNMWDMIMRTMELPVRATVPAIAQHTYHDYVNPRPTKGLVEKNKFFDDWKDTDICIAQSSSLSSSYFRASAVIRFLDRPFMITEYSHCFPNQYRHERGLYFASYAALQGWDALMPHQNTVRPMFWEPMTFFESAQDPISRASETVAALAWARGDVKESPHTVALEMSSDRLFPKNYLSAIGDEYAQIALLTKIGILYPEIKPAMPVGKAPKADLLLIPEGFAPLRVSQWYVSAATGGDKRFAPLLEKLRNSGILGKDNRTNLKEHIYQSDTGELLLDTENKTMKVITPRLEGAILKQNQTTALNALTITSATKPASIVVASLNKNQTIVETDRILLIVASNAFNTDMVFEDKTMRRVCSLGTLPPLMESLQCGIELKSNQKKAPQVYALYMDGTRAQKIDCTFENGKLLLPLDTSKLKYGTPYFEIIYEDLEDFRRTDNIITTICRRILCCAMRRF